MQHSEQDCFRDAAFTLHSGCRSLSVSKQDKVEYALLLTLCELSTANVQVPTVCIPPFKENGKARQCVMELARVPQTWTSYSGYFRDAESMCLAIRYPLERELVEQLHQNITKQQISNLALLQKQQQQMTEGHLHLLTRYSFTPFSCEPTTNSLLNYQHTMNDIPEDVNVDSIIARLLEVRGNRPGKQVQLAEHEIRFLCGKSRDIFMSQPILLDLEAPLKICGDIHGQYYDLLRLFEYGGFPPESNYLFLGDYVDRGKQSLETICLLLAYKIKYPENFFILRGNHESASINRIYGFYDECKRRYNIKLWKTFTDCFNCLPIAAVIDEKIFTMHGGLSPDLQSLEQIRRVMRPTDVPDTGLLCDLLWSDPDKDVQGWSENDRGVSFTFGPDIVSKFLQKHDMDLICRAHQVVEDGYEFFAKRQLVTLFSAPNYCGEFDNAGAMMTVDESLLCSFQILKPAEKKSRNAYNGRGRYGK